MLTSVQKGVFIIFADLGRVKILTYVCIIDRINKQGYNKQEYIMRPAQAYRASGFALKRSVGIGVLFAGAGGAFLCIAAIYNFIL